MNKDSRPFVDRKEYLQTFIESVNKIGQKKFSILVCHGVAGIGKTSLRKEFPKHLEKYNQKNQQREVIWASIDLDLDKHREKSTFLVTLKNELQKKHRIDFPAFEIAHAIYWKKANPEIPLIKKNYLFFEGDDAFDDFFEVVDKIPYFSLVPTVTRLIKSSPDTLRKWWTKREKAELNQLSDKEPLEIEEMLPYFWAQDLNHYLEKTSKPAVLFIDTYEALWEKDRGQGNFNARDEWVRKLILNLSRSCLWVICGREELRWKEVDRDWNNYLEQYRLEKLPEKDAFNFLTRCGIKEEEIQKVIIKCSEGVPYYLELAVDAYTEIAKTSPPKPSDFATTQGEIFDRFMKYLGNPEQETLKVLSTPRFWNKEIFRELINNFKTGYSLTAFSELSRFSFVQETEGKLLLHPLMRESLQVYQDQKLKEEAHSFMRAYYSDQLRIIDIKTITPEHEIALIEAFYHAKESHEAEELYEWLNSASDPFERAAFWKLIYPLYEKLLPLLEEKLGSKHPYVAETRRKLALLYCRMGAYKEAIDFYEQALTIAIEKMDRYEGSVVSGYLGRVYRELGDYNRAIEYHNDALAISREIGKRNLDVIHLGNLGNAYLDQANFDKAIDNYKKALKIAKEIGDKPGKSVNFENLGNAYLDQAKFYEAIVNYEKALKIAREIGNKHRESVNFGNLGVVYRELGDYGKAIEYHNDALTISREIGKRNLEVNHLGNLGNAYRDQANFDEAIDNYEKALKIAREIGDRRNEGIWLGNYGSAFRYKGEINKAINNHWKALKIARLISDKRNEGVWCGNLGITYGELKKFEKAIEYHNNALKIACEIGDKRNVGIWCGNLGIAYYKLGERERGFDYYRKALKVAEKIGDKRNVGVWQGYKGDAYLDMGDPIKAIEYYEKALEIAEEIGDKRRIGKWQGHMGNAYLNLGDPIKAIEYYEKALEIAEEIGDKRKEEWQNLARTTRGSIQLSGNEIKKHCVWNESQAIEEEIEDIDIIKFCEQELRNLKDSMNN